MVINTGKFVKKGEIVPTVDAVLRAETKNAEKCKYHSCKVETESIESIECTESGKMFYNKMDLFTQF